MAYSTDNPPALVVQGIGGVQPNIWTYKSTDATGTVDGAGYFTNGLTLGMKVGDLVILSDTTNGLATMHRVHAVTSTGADLGTGISIGSSANAD